MCKVVSYPANKGSMPAKEMVSTEVRNPAVEMP